MYMALALALLSPATSGSDAGAGTVQGTIKITEDGYPLRCRSVYLIPASPKADELVALKFGESEEVSTPVPLPQIAKDTDPSPDGRQESSCRRGRFSNSFEFSSVAAGDYYLTALATPRSSNVSEDQLSRSSVEMVRRISVAPDSSVEVHFR